MRCFLLSLFVFILLMCSCKSKKMATDVRFQELNTSGLSYSFNSWGIDTTKVRSLVELSQSLVVEENIRITEYDAESGKPIKETKTKRTITQDTNEVANQEEARGIETHSLDSLNHFADVNKKIDSETEAVTKNNGLDSFGKWLGIALGCIIGILIVSLLKKFRVN